MPCHERLPQADDDRRVSLTDKPSQGLTTGGLGKVLTGLGTKGCLEIDIGASGFSSLFLAVELYPGSASLPQAGIDVDCAMVPSGTTGVRHASLAWRAVAPLDLSPLPPRWYRVSSPTPFNRVRLRSRSDTAQVYLFNEVIPLFRRASPPPRPIAVGDRFQVAWRIGEPEQMHGRSAPPGMSITMVQPTQVVVRIGSPRGREWVIPRGFLPPGPPPRVGQTLVLARLPPGR